MVTFAIVEQAPVLMHRTRFTGGRFPASGRDRPFVSKKGLAGDLVEKVGRFHPDGKLHDFTGF
jgi:hypothetical protein